MAVSEASSVGGEKKALFVARLAWTTRGLEIPKDPEEQVGRRGTAAKQRKKTIIRPFQSYLL
jgi:hypothetical protein